MTTNPLPKGYVYAPQEAVDLLERPLDDLMPWDYQTLKALNKMASQINGRWVLKVGVKVAKQMQAEGGNS